MSVERRPDPNEPASGSNGESVVHRSSPAIPPTPPPPDYHGSIPPRQRKLAVLVVVVAVVVAIVASIVANVVTGTPISWFWLISANTLLAVLLGIFVWVRLSE